MITTAIVFYFPPDKSLKTIQIDGFKWFRNTMGVLRSIQRFSSEKVESYGAQYDAFWIFMLIFYLMPPITWAYWHPGPYPNSLILALRLFSFLLGGVIAIRRYWPTILKPYLPVFWHFTLFFWCAFRSIFILLYSAHSKGFSIYGPMGIFLLAVLADEVSYTVLLIFGVVITPIFFYSTGGLAADFPTSQSITQTFWMILTITFFKWVFFRKQRSQAIEKVKCYQKVAGTVAHEMRIPLSSIFIAAKGLGNKITEENSNDVRRIQLHIQKLAYQAQTTIDMLLFRLGKHIPQTEYTECFLKACVEEALVEYPFEAGEKDTIKLEQMEDFVFFGNHRLIVHVIFNLIKNALYAMKQSGKGGIFISLDANRRQLRFKDTAIGICPKESGKLFKDFYTTKSDGTGMGLSFCKQTMMHIGGDITCLSEKGRFSEFVVTFPQIERGHQI